MTVQELISVMPFCDLLEVVVRQTGHGRWIQGYRIGKEVRVFPSEASAEFRESRALKEYENKTVRLHEGEIVDVKHFYHADMPMKIICKDCQNKLPDYVGRLEVAFVQPRYIPAFHKEHMTDNSFCLEVDAYPDNYVSEVFIESKDITQKQLTGQMSISDFIGATS